MSPGRAAAASSSSARLSGPPDTAIPMRAPGGISGSRSPRKRSRTSTLRPEDCASTPVRPVCRRAVLTFSADKEKSGSPTISGARRIGDESPLTALRLRLAVVLKFLEVGADFGAVYCVEFRIGLASLRGLAELHQCLPQIIEAVLRALATGVGAVIGEQRIGGATRIALVQQGATDEIVRVAAPAVFGIGSGERLQRTDRLVVLASLPHMEPRGVGVFPRIGGRGFADGGRRGWFCQRGGRLARRRSPRTRGRRCR